MSAAITVIELWPFYSTCKKCGCDTRAKLGWPYDEDFIIGDGEPWQERGGYVPVCEWCYRELDELESRAGTRRDIQASDPRSGSAEVTVTCKADETIAARPIRREPATYSAQQTFDEAGK